MTEAGNIAFKAGNFNDAMLAYRLSISQAVEPAVAVKAWSNIALCYLRLNDPASAYAACQSGLKLHADHVKLTYRAAAAVISATVRNPATSASGPSAKVEDETGDDAFPTLANADSTAAALARLLESSPDRELHEQLARLMRARGHIQRAGVRAPREPAAEMVGASRQSGRRPRRFLPVAPTMLRSGCIADLRFQHSEDGVDENLLVLLHGLGDSAAGFARFGAGMELPQTAVLSLSGPQTVPVVGGHAWFTALDSDSLEPVSLRYPHSVRAADMAKLVPLLYASLLDIAAAWRITLDHVHLLGFGDGGTIALHLALHAQAAVQARKREATAAAAAATPAAGASKAAGEASTIAAASEAARFDAAANPELFASVISIGGPLLPETRRALFSSAAAAPASSGAGAAGTAAAPDASSASSSASAATSPVFFMSAARLDGSVAAECAETLDALQTGAAHATVQHVLLPPPRFLKDDIARARTLRKGPKAESDEQREEPPIARIPRGRDEVEPMMAFFASRLRRRLTALEDDDSVVELA